MPGTASPLPPEPSPTWRPTRVEWRAFWVLFVASVLVSLAHGRVDFFPYDANYYFFRLGNATQATSLFEALADQLRGYVPLTLFGAIRAITDAVGVDARDVVPVLNALLFAWISAILVPRFAEDAWPRGDWGVARRVLLGAVLLVFWSGYLWYPLSDFPALAAGLAAILLARRARSSAGWFAAGCSASVAVNLRPAYLVLAGGVVVLAWFAARAAPRRGSTTRPGQALACVAAGAALVALPQSALSGSRYGAWSPVPGAASNLGTFQLTSGLRLALYGSVVDDTPPLDAALNYRDSAGEKLVRPSDLARVDYGQLRGQLLVRDSSTYAGIVLRDPIGYAALLVRHLVNGADQRYATPYPAVLDHGQRRLFRIAGFIGMWLALARLCWPVARRSLGPARWGGAIVLLGGLLTILPAAVEQRFMLPLFVVAMALVCAPGWRQALDESRAASGRRQALVAGLLVASFAAYGALVGGIAERTSSSLDRSSLTITKYPWRFP